MTYKLYMSKLNKNSNRLWQKPKQGYRHYNNDEWYEKNIVGEKTINSFMKTFIKDAQLETNMYTNHSIRATCIHTLDKNSFEARHITAISGHKNEATIRTYSTKCPENKKRQMYEALKDSVIAKKPKTEPTATVSKPSEEENTQDLQTINVNDLQDLQVDMNVNQNNNNTELPANFQLMPFEFEQDSDDFLLNYINSAPQMQKLESPPNTTILAKTTTTNTMSRSMPIIPKMYFPNSNVTINYNFNAK